MSQSPTLEKYIESLQSVLGLSSTQANVILPLYLGGHMTVGAIALMTGEKIPRVEKTLEELIERGLVVKTDGVVSLYQAVSPILAAASNFSIISKKIQDLKSATEKHIQTQLSQLTLSTEESSKASHTLVEQLNIDLDSYEQSIATVVQEQVNALLSVVKKIMSEFSERVAGLLAETEKSLDVLTAQNVATLQFELDNIHRRLESDMNAIASEFDAWLQTEQSSATKSVKNFDTTTERLVASATEAITRALSDSLNAIRSVFDELSHRLNSESSDAIQQSISTLHTLSDTLAKTVTSIQSCLTTAQSTARTALADSLAQVDKEYQKESKSVQNRIVSVADSVVGMQSDLESWHKEVGQQLDLVLQLLTEHLQSVLVMQQTYHDKVRTSTTFQVDIIVNQIHGEYQYLRDLIATIMKDMDAYISETRRSFVTLLESDIETELSRLSKMLEEFHTNLDKWSKSTSKTFTKQVTDISTEVTALFNTEAEEICSVAENLRSRLKSAFSSVLSTSAASNESTLSELNKMIEELKSSFNSQLDTTTSEYIGVLEKNIENSHALFNSTVARLDNLIAESIKRLNLQAEEVQKSVDSSLSERLAQMEQQTGHIVDEFHSYVDELTNQFLEVTKRVKNSFSSLVSSRTVESRKLIASAQNDFKNIVQSEIAAMTSLSADVRQDFASTLDERIEVFNKFVETSRKLLEQLVTTRQSDLAEVLNVAFMKFNLMLKGIHDSLIEISSTTIPQLGDDFITVAQETGAVVRSTASTVSQRLDVASQSLSTAVNKSTTSARALLESTVAEQKDSLKALVNEFGTGLDLLSAKIAKTVTERTDSHRTEAAVREAEVVKNCTASLDAVLSELQSYRVELSEGIDAKTASIHSTIGEITTVLKRLVKRLNDRLKSAHERLIKSADETGSALLETGEKNIATLKEILDASLSDLEHSVMTTSQELEQQDQSEFGAMLSRLSQLSDALADMVNTALTTSVSSVESHNKTILAQISGELTNIRSSAQSAAEACNRLIEQLGRRSIEAGDSILEKARTAFLECTMSISRAEESVGRDFNKHVGDVLHKYLDGINTEFGLQKEQLRTTHASIIGAVTESSSRSKQMRNESLSNFSSDVEKTLRKFLADMDKVCNTLRHEFGEIMTESGTTLDSFEQVLSSLSAAAKELSRLPTDDTWYVSGKAEISSHVLDMVLRAEESIVISVPDPTLVDLKKLARVKQPHSRVLVLPTDEETVSELEQLVGWRIWHYKSPPLLAVRDNQELLMGSSEDIEKSIALVSTAPGYLRLFHDVLGPMLTRMRES